LGFTEKRKKQRNYREIANRISDTLDFMAAAGVDIRDGSSLQSVEIDTSARIAGCWNTKRRLCRQEQPVPANGWRFRHNDLGSATAPSNPMARMWKFGSAVVQE